MLAYQFLLSCLIRLKFRQIEGIILRPNLTWKTIQNIQDNEKKNVSLPPVKIFSSIEIQFHKAFFCEINVFH